MLSSVPFQGSNHRTADQNSISRETLLHLRIFLGTRAVTANDMRIKVELMARLQWHHLHAPCQVPL
jgi:hypothetical protein